MNSTGDMFKDIRAMGLVLKPVLSKAFVEVDRADFVLAEYKNLAYENTSLPLDCGQTISQPFTVAFMLDLLDARPGEKILEVGSGSGWQTALLAFLVGPKGRVVAIERVRKVFESGLKNLSLYPKLLRHCRLICGNGREGFEQESPFDAVIASASAQAVPQAWRSQVRIGGRIIAPVDGNIVRLVKVGTAEFTQESFSGFVFVPLI